MKTKLKQKQVNHYRSGCIGCGMCAYICPKYFAMNHQDGLADLISSEKVKDFYKKSVELGDEEITKDAARSCPVNVIKVEG